MSVPAVDGLHPDVPDFEYHADLHSLSSSGARALISTCPAKFDHKRRNPDNPKPAYDFGHAWHKLVLGDGPEIVEVPFEEWRTDKAKAMRDEAWAEHKVPLRPSAIARAHEMVEVVRQHPIAGPLLFEYEGYPELSGYWTDPLTGIRLRYRPDRLVLLPDGRVVCIDGKTADDASPAHISKQSADYGYFQQDPWYRDGLIANDVTDAPAFLFIAQEKEEPYLVSVLQHHPDDIQRGRELNRAAIDLYAQCVAEKRWPGYGDTIHTIRMPGWHASQHEVRLEAVTNLLHAA